MLRLPIWLCLVLLTLPVAEAQLSFGRRHRSDLHMKGFQQVEMPGERYRGPLPELTAAQRTLRDQLKSDLTRLAGVIGERNVRHPENYAAAALFLEKSLGEMGLEVERQEYRAGGQTCVNLAATVAGGDRADPA